MKVIEFKKLLDARGYSYTNRDEQLVITHKGSVFLYSFTTLPKGIEFNHQGNVCLYSLTILPKDIQFNNQGSVSLNNLTILPKDIEFNNKGYVNLDNLLSLPEDIEFNNQGYVRLYSLTTLPKGIEFNNQGNVYLNSLDGEFIYRNKTINLMNIDGSTMLVESSKQIEDITLLKCRYFGGGALSKLSKCYIAKRDEYSAHGATSREAIDDLNFKYLQATLDVSDLVRQIKRKGVITVNDYRLLTGACREGCANFLKLQELDVQELPLKEVLDLTENAYGGLRMQELFVS